MEWHRAKAIKRIERTDRVEGAVEDNQRREKREPADLTVEQ